MVSSSIYLSRKRTFEKIKWFEVYEVSDLMLERVLKGEWKRFVHIKISSVQVFHCAIWLGKGRYPRENLETGFYKAIFTRTVESKSWTISDRVTFVNMETSLKDTAQNKLKLTAQHQHALHPFCMTEVPPNASYK